MNFHTYQLFVGSCNDTHKLEMDKIRGVLDLGHDGYTIYQAKGCWKGGQEDTAVIILTDTLENVMETIYILKDQLNQEAIALQELPSLALV